MRKLRELLRGSWQAISISLDWNWQMKLMCSQVFPKPSLIEMLSPLFKGSAWLSFAWEHIPAHHNTATALNMFVIDLLCWLHLFSFIYAFIVNFTIYKVSQGPVLLDFRKRCWKNVWLPHNSFLKLKVLFKSNFISCFCNYTQIHPKYFFLVI